LVVADHANNLVTGSSIEVDRPVILSADRRQDTPVTGFHQAGFHLACARAGNAPAPESRFRIGIVGETNIGGQLDFTRQVLNSRLFGCDPASMRDLVSDVHDEAILTAIKGLSDFFEIRLGPEYRVAGQIRGAQKREATCRLVVLCLSAFQNAFEQ
jgi:hypothetical protein